REEGRGDRPRSTRRWRRARAWRPGRRRSWWWRSRWWWPRRRWRVWRWRPGRLLRWGYDEREQPLQLDVCRIRAQRTEQSEPAGSSYESKLAVVRDVQRIGATALFVSPDRFASGVQLLAEDRNEEAPQGLGQRNGSPTRSEEVRTEAWRNESHRRQAQAPGKAQDQLAAGNGVAAISPVSRSLRL